MGDRIRFIRTRLGLSERELGLMLSPCHSAHFVQAVEAHQLIPSIHFIIQISACGGVSLDWLLKDQDPRAPGK